MYIDGFDSMSVAGSNSNGNSNALTKENILLLSNGGRDFYEFVIPELKLKAHKKAFENCKNPFYDDTNPSLSIYQQEDNNWCFLDFGNDAYKGDVFNFASYHYKLDTKCNFRELLEKINTDLNLGLRQLSENLGSESLKNTEIIRSFIVTKRKHLTKKELSYFKQYGISNDILDTYKVFSLESYINEYFKITQATEDSPIFAFEITNNCYKIYRPYAINYQKKFLWLGKKPDNYQDVFGIEHLPEFCDTILITEGYKDCLTVVANFANKGIYAVALDSALTKLSQFNIYFLKSKCKNLLLCLDIDKKGLEASEKLMRRHNIKRVLLPEKLSKIINKSTGKPYKDISDYVYLYINEPFKYSFFTNNGISKLVNETIDSNSEQQVIQSQKEPEDFKKLARFNILMQSKEILKVNKSKPVIFSRPIISRENNGVIFPNTINVIQGKSGVHKSRLAETICSCLLAKNLQQNDFLGFKTDPFKAYSLCLVDTERNLKESLPYALQNIQTKAGFTIEDNLSNFEFVSLIDIPREERLLAISDYLDYIRLSFNNHIFIILDVITDCISNFNDPKESLKLIDLMNQLINQHDVTFLCLIHENPSSADKARGHLGTEIFNKASTVLQIGFEKDGKLEDTNIIKVKYLKCRNSIRLNPFYIKYDEAEKGLVLADEVEITEVSNSRKKKAHLEDIKERLEQILVDPTKKQIVYETLMLEFNCSVKIIDKRIEEIIYLKSILTNVQGKACILIKEQIGREVYFSLRVQDVTYEED